MRPAVSLILTKRPTPLPAQHCSSYDAQVSEWLWSKVGSGPAPMMTVPMTLQQTLRYGENPHQPAAFYTDSSLREFKAGGVATSIVHWGKEMSYNNFLVRRMHPFLVLRGLHACRQTGPSLAGCTDGLRWSRRIQRMDACMDAPALTAPV